MEIPSDWSRILPIASERGMAEVIREYVKSVNGNANQAEIWLIVQTATVNGHKKILEIVLEVTDFGYKHAHSEHSMGAIALLNAATHNRFEIVDFLLDHGVGINQVNGHGSSALLSAIQAEIEDAHFMAETTGYLPTPSADMTEFLLARGADVTFMDDLGNTPLGVARNNHPKAAKLLKERGAAR